jgi:hypothetical protein
LAVSLLLLIGTLAQAGVVDAVEVDVANHSVAMPFDHLGRTTPLHPALFVRAEHHWLGGRVLGLHQDLHLGGFHDPLMGTSAMFGTDLTGRATASFGLMGEASLGLGVSHSFRARPVLKWNDEDKTYAPATDFGRPGITGGFGLGLGYDFRRLTRTPMTLLVTYDWFGQSPWLPAIPVGPQGALGVGIRWTLGGDT